MYAMRVGDGRTGRGECDGDRCGKECLESVKRRETNYLGVEGAIVWKTCHELDYYHQTERNVVP